MARLLRVAVLLVAVLAACAGPSPASRDEPGRAGAPPSPTAARILAPPQTPAPAPIADSGVAALIRRVTLYHTDVPAELVEQPAELEDALTAAARAPDPAGFLARAQQWGRTLSLRTAFTAASPNVVRSITAVTLHFATSDGAQAQFGRVRAEGLPALLADAGLSAAVVPSDRAQPAPPPAAGEEALGWRWLNRDSEPAGEVVTFRRGAFVAVVVVSGTGDAGALAQVLDRRAVAAQPGGR